MQVYRLLRRAFAASGPFSGEGSFLHGGRWSSPGIRLSYASTHRSLAILEYRAHIDPAFAPEDLVIATLTLPDEIAAAPTPTLPSHWRNSPPPGELRSIGDRFVTGATAAIMLIPSVIVPEENNVLINPLHPDFSRAHLDPELAPFRYDNRLL